MRKVVLMAQDSELTRLFYEIAARDVVFDRILLEGPVDRVAMARRRVRRLGLSTVVGQLLFQLLIQRGLAKLSRGRIRQILQQAGVGPAPLPPEKVVRVDSFNTDAGRRALADLDADLVVVHGTRILSQKTIDAACAPMVNFHAGVTPLYRGVHGGYWALARGDSENFGVTLHRIDAGIDTGEPLAQQRIEPGPGDNFATYPYLQTIAGARLLGRVAPALLRGEHLAAAAPRQSQLWYHPTVWQYCLTGLTRGVW